VLEDASKNKDIIISEIAVWLHSSCEHLACGKQFENPPFWEREKETVGIPPDSGTAFGVAAQWKAMAGTGIVQSCQEFHKLPFLM
jgi:hypothetical protein